MGPIENRDHAQVLKGLYARRHECQSALWTLEGLRSDHMVTGGNDLLIEGFEAAIRHCRGEWERMGRELDNAYGVLGCLSSDRIDWIVNDVQLWLDERNIAG